MVINVRADLDQLIINRITFLNESGVTGTSFTNRLEELLWLRDEVKQIPYSYTSTTQTGDK